MMEQLSPIELKGPIWLLIMYTLSPITEGPEILELIISVPEPIRTVPSTFDASSIVEELFISESSV